MKSGGFTLIELLIVIIIISILSIAIVPMTISLLKATFIETHSAFSRSEATFLTNSRFIDALYPMQFAVCTYTTANRTQDNITSDINIYTATSFDENKDIIHQLHLQKITIRNNTTQLTSNGKPYPFIAGISINHLNFFYGDKIIRENDSTYKPFSNLSVKYEGITLDNQSIEATVGLTKITAPFPLPIACFDSDTYTATTGKIIYLYFTQPIINNPNISHLPPDYITIKCDGIESTIQDVTYHGPNPSYLSININTNTIINPSQCTIILKNSNTIKSYDGYTISDLINILDGHTPYIEVNGTCP